ncbi:MAG TPA: ATP-binding cassette domain-containing protein [Candidatus Thalassarchaeaceae archaeon]|nr:ATP-binding cassette domain-containing protein [Candidatus Thalassarchaeaceae archaeon]
MQAGSNPDKPILVLKDVAIGYDPSVPLVKVPDLQVFPGEIIAIAGPSGIGKSTLLRTIAGLVSPISGTLEVCGRTLPESPPRGHLGYVPQKLGLVRHASVRHNVDQGARAGTSVRKDRKERSIRAIEQMGLTEKSREPIRRLSGGQQRRVATARTLAQRPRLILADEFLSELDEETLSSVLEAVTNYVRENNASLIVVEHDITRAKMMADKLLVIDDGRINPFIKGTKALEVNI